ncbi:signal peptidase I SipW [Neobacillus niacini]|uniref:signal peptidase I SipW n=1 Tax=Neobacillus niacini TaxID=86668 RepID=UPI001C8D718B|nr:signal peptidase I [Neobacillus niacini]MBY0148717.1 signal peptidase I [Neobacillus niacini]
MKTFRKWAGRISSIIIYGLLICMVMTVITTKVNGGTAKVFGYEIMTVLSGSMEPSIKTGSIIAVKPVPAASELKKGDVITFKASDNPNTLITHRIVEVERVNESVQFITKGDNNDTKDTAHVNSQNIVGAYSGFTLPFIGKLLAFIQSNNGAIFLLIVPGVLMILWSVINFWREISKVNPKEVKPTG